LRKLLDSRGKQPIDARRRRHRCDIVVRDPPPLLTTKPVLVDQHAQHLFDEQRIAFGGIRDARPKALGQGTRPEEVLDQAVALLVGEGIELDAHRRGRGARPPGALLQQFGTRYTQNEDGGSPAPSLQVFDQV
jgi:hypothetical protein